MEMLCGSCAWISAVFVACFVVWIMGAGSPKKLLGVYSLPTRTYYLKVAVFYLFIQFRKWQQNRRRSTHGEKRPSEAGFGIESRSCPEEMDCPQPLSSHPKAIDAVYFSAADAEGRYLVMATARRPNGVFNGIFYLRIPGVGLLEMPRMPDTLLFGDPNKFSAEGIEICPLVPMQKWSLKYDGKMKLHSDSTKEFDVSARLTWTTDHPYFDFDTDMHPLTTARAMAKEEWSRKYFQSLKDAHQTHYEHMGHLSGSAVINGTQHDLRHLNSLRDHSYGHKREWKLIHRYGLHMFHTESGMSINVGVVSQPVTCSHLELGFISRSNEKLAVSSVNFQLYQFGENGSPPKDYAFSFIAGGEEYVVEVQIVEKPEFYIGWEWETRMCEYMATFRINGSKGWGIVEWAYRNEGGRPKEYSEKDPKIDQITE